LTAQSSARWANAIIAGNDSQYRLARITGAKPVSYTITRKPGRAGRYLTAAWACAPTTSDAVCAPSPDTDVGAGGPVVGVDLNDGHLARRRLDAHGNPVGPPMRLDVDLTGSSARTGQQRSTTPVTVPTMDTS
jgi:hypothetical protein